MFSMIYDEERAIQVAREEALEEGQEKSIAIIRALKEKVPVDVIAVQYNIPKYRVEQFLSVLML